MVASAALPHLPAETPETFVEQCERYAKWPMIVMALLVIPTVIIEESTVSHRWRRLAENLNWAIWIAFACELLVGTLLVWVVTGTLEWLRSHKLELFIVCLTGPFLAPSFGAFRLLRLLEIPKRLRPDFSPDGIKLAALFAAICAFSGASIFAHYEHKHSMWDGAWWAMATMATVGYGDLSPKSVYGRLAGIALMFIGVGFFALVTGAIAQRFLSPQVQKIGRTEETAKTDIVSTEVETREQVLREIRKLSAQVEQIERAVQKL
jgi:voltage-gated potassium channel